MRIRFFFPLLFLFTLFGCSRSSDEQSVVPPATHPLAREYIGFAVVNVSFIHLLSEPGQAGISQGYLRRGTVVRIIERPQLINRGNVESWILAENYQAFSQRTEDSAPRGWIEESMVEIYDSESRANTASRNMSR